MKDTFYFPHDYNAKSDDKLLELRDKYKNEGYAVFFYCLETMAERRDGYILPSLIGGLSLGYGVAKEWLLGFLNFCVKIGLFLQDDKGFYSPRMIEHLNMRNLFRIKGKEGAKLRWKNSPPNSPPNAKERKGKERKVKKNTVAETATSLIIGKETFMTEELIYEPIEGSPRKSKYGKKTMAILAVQYARLAGITLPETFDASEWSRPLGSMYRYFDKDVDKTIAYMKKAIQYFEEKNLTYAPQTLDRDKTMMDKWIGQTTAKQDVSERRRL